MIEIVSPLLNTALDLIFQDTGSEDHLPDTGEDKDFFCVSDDDEDLDVDFFSTGDSDSGYDTPDFESMWSLPTEDKEFTESEGDSVKMRGLVDKLKRWFFRIVNGLSFETRLRKRDVMFCE